MNAAKIALSALALITCVGCTGLLVREYLRTRARLLLWSSLCFLGLTVNNLLLFIDLVVLPAIDLRVVRLTAALVGMCFLLYGFIWEAEA